MKLPLFVSMKHKLSASGTAMRLVKDHYHRDAGAWDCGFKFVDGVLLSVDLYKDNYMGPMPWLEDNLLVPISENEWRADSGHYVDHLDFTKKVEFCLMDNKNEPKFVEWTKEKPKAVTRRW